MLNDDIVIAAFSEDHVERLTGISRRQLQHWDKRGFFAPSLVDEERRRPYSRIYSFRDVACLQVLNALRNEAGVPFHHLQDVKEELAHLGDDMWAKTTLYVLNKRVIIENPETSEKEEIVSGQGVLQIPLQLVKRNLERAVQLLWTRDESTIGQVAKQRGVAGSTPVIAGTRISVRSIKAFSDAGYSIEKIRDEYPALTEDDIRAALAHGKAA